VGLSDPRDPASIHRLPRRPETMQTLAWQCHAPTGRVETPCAPNQAAPAHQPHAFALTRAAFSRRPTPRPVDQPSPGVSIIHMGVTGQSPPHRAAPRSPGTGDPAKVTAGDPAAPGMLPWVSRSPGPVPAPGGDRPRPRSTKRGRGAAAAGGDGGR